MELARWGGLKRLFFDRMFHRSYWIWRKHPAIMVPTMIGTGVTTIGESIVTLGVVLVLVSLAQGHTLYDFLVSTRDQGLFQSMLSPNYITTTLPVALVIGIVLIVALVVGGGFVISSEYSTYLEAWQADKASFRSIIENGSRTWKGMAWTLLLSTIITWAPLIAGGIIVLVSIQGIGTIQGVAGVLSGVYVLLFGLGASLFLAIFTLYSYPAVVVDHLSGFRAVRRSFTVASHNLGTSVTYGIVRVIFTVLSSLVAVFASYVGLPLTSLATAILSLLLTPVLHSTKTMIYYNAGPSVPEMRFTVENPIWSDIARRLPRAAWHKVKLGLSETSRYIIGPKNLPFHAASTLGLVVGIVLGEFVSNNGVRRFYYDVLGYKPGQLNPLLTQVVPPVLGVDIFLHNWLVSIGAATSGIGFAFPSFETILFNGFIIGILAPLVPTLRMFLAVILPHGIIEIPSFLLAGSVGIKLGYAAIRTKTSPGPEGTEYLSTVLRQAVYIVVGLAPLFLIAGLIESNLTPFIARMFGWT